jgi:hypothetical protein
MGREASSGRSGGFNRLGRSGTATFIMIYSIGSHAGSIVKYP